MCNLIIYNKNYKQNIKINYAGSYIKRLMGLMFKKQFAGLLFKQKYNHKLFNTIHTTFMKTPIDVLYINRNNKIQETATVRPWKIYIPHKNNIKYIIELPPNTIKNYKIKINMKIEIK